MKLFLNFSAFSTYEHDTCNDKDYPGPKLDLHFKLGFS